MCVCIYLVVCVVWNQRNMFIQLTDYTFLLSKCYYIVAAAGAPVLPQQIFVLQNSIQITHLLYTIIDRKI